MTYSSLLVFTDDSAASDARLELACDLADRFDAAVIGISASLPEPPMYDPIGGLGDVLGMLREAAEDDVRRAKARFDTIVAARGVRAEWRGGVGSPASLVARAARAADLIVLGPKTSNTPYRSPDPADVLMAIGRPVLIVPDGFSTSPLDGHALVAWKDTREAQRVVTASLPLLVEASDVRVIEIAAPGKAEEAAFRIEDVAHFLARHEVKAEGKVVIDDEHSTTTLILGEAKASKADLIVAGGYGHTRLREWVLGGVTHGLLDRSPVCVLLAH